MKPLPNIFSSPFFINVSKLLSVNVLVQIFAFALSVIITRLYSQDDFGLLAKFMSVASIFILFATLRLEFAIILPKKNEDANALVSLGFLFSITSAILCFIVLHFFSDNLNLYFKINAFQDWKYIMPLMVFFVASFHLLLNYKNRQKKYNKLALGQVIQGVSNPSASIFFHKLVNFGLIQAVLFANFLGTIYLGFTLINQKIFKSRSSLKAVLKKYYRFPTFNMAHALVNNLSTSLPVLMLSPIFENYLIGLFTMALGKMFRPINLFSNVIYQVFSKKIVDDLHLKKSVSKQFLKVVSTLFVVGLLPFIVMYFFAPEIFAFVFGVKWYQAGEYLKLLLPWLFMVYLTGSFSFYSKFVSRTKKCYVYRSSLSRIAIFSTLLWYYAKKYGKGTFSIFLGRCFGVMFYALLVLFFSKE